MVLQVKGVVLPEREERSFWIDDGVFRSDPLIEAELVIDGGWLLPGLVDLHTHPGSTGPDDPFDDAKLRRDLTIHRDAASWRSGHPVCRPGYRAGSTTIRNCPTYGRPGGGWPRPTGSTQATDVTSPSMSSRRPAWKRPLL